MRRWKIRPWCRQLRQAGRASRSDSVIGVDEIRKRRSKNASFRTGSARLRNEANSSPSVATMAHVEGRMAIGEMINPGRGQRQRAIFDRVEWL